MSKFIELYGYEGKFEFEKSWLEKTIAYIFTTNLENFLSNYTYDDAELINQFRINEKNFG